MYTDTEETAICTATSIVNTYRSLQCFIKQHSDWIVKIIFNPLVSLAILKDFALFKCRIYLANLFENGLVIDHDRRMEIIYYIRDTQYSIVTPKHPGRRPILHIEGYHDPESSDRIDLREKLGPYGNFHGIPTSPSLLGFSGVEVTYRKGRNKVTYLDDSRIETVDIN
jgi:hypothetical protein